jgi:hypothetical protein
MKRKQRPSTPKIGSECRNSVTKKNRLDLIIYRIQPRGLFSDLNGYLSAHDKTPVNGKTSDFNFHLGTVNIEVEDETGKLEEYFPGENELSVYYDVGLSGSKVLRIDSDQTADFKFEMEHFDSFSQLAHRNCIELVRRSYDSGRRLASVDVYLNNRLLQAEKTPRHFQNDLKKHMHVVTNFFYNHTTNG